MVTGHRALSKPRRVVTEVFEASPVSAADQLRREFEAAGSTTGTGGSGIQGVVEQSNEDLGSPVPGLQEAAKHNSAAEELERELAALRSQLTSTGPPAESAAVSGGVAGFGTQDQSSEPDSGGFLRRGELDTSSGDLPEAVAPAPASEPEPSSPVPETYSGRVYLMFPATLTQDQLESVWDSLEEVGGSGSISDHRLVSRQDGVQFTLELGNKDLVVDRLRKQMPGAGLTALAADRLGIDWPKRA